MSPVREISSKQIPVKVVRYLKGGNSYRFFKLYPDLKKRYWSGSLWSSGKFYRFVGNITTDIIKHYLRNHRRDLEQVFYLSDNETWSKEN